MQLQLFHYCYWLNFDFSVREEDKILGLYKPWAPNPLLINYYNNIYYFELLIYAAQYIQLKIVAVCNWNILAILYQPYFSYAKNNHIFSGSCWNILNETALFPTQIKCRENGKRYDLIIKVSVNLFSKAGYSLASRYCNRCMCCNQKT